MDNAPLVGAVHAAHRKVADRVAALAGADASNRGERLAGLSEVVHATGRAEEAVLFPMLRRLTDDDVLADTCAAEHRDAVDRLEAMAGHLDGPGFATSLEVLAKDLRNHMDDEEHAALPALLEALDREQAADVAVRFERALRA